MTVRFRSEAVADVLAAREWYDARRAGLGEEFVTSLEHVVQIISDLPSAFPEVSSGLRRALLGRFPYALYYRIDAEFVEVVACLHTRPSPSRWRSRGEV